MPDMKLKDLLSRRLIFISGKGGVGKTTLTVLLGLLASSQKKNTILVEMNASGRIPPLFGTEAAPHREIPIAPYLSTINITPPQCFEEYVLRHIRFKSIYEIFFNNAFVMNFINATPGLAEVLMLGKIYDLVLQENKKSNEPLHDLILVDAPASGHGLSALEVPKIILETVKIGPLHHTAKKMVELFGDHEQTALSLVTLGEEMPVNETEELYHALQKRMGMAFGPIFVNRIISAPATLSISLKKIPSSLALYKNYYELGQHRAELNLFYFEELRRRLPGEDFIALDELQHDLEGKNDLKALLKILKEALS